MPSSGRYQSRVLSFLSQQSMQWRDRAAKAARQARLAVTWGTQMALYPIYVLFQSTRLVGYQLRQTVTRLMPLLEAVKEEDFDPQVGAPLVNSDDLIHKMLAYLETLDLPVILSPRSLTQETVRSLPAAERELLHGSGSEGWIYPAVPLQFDSELQRSLSLEFLSDSNSASNISASEIDSQSLGSTAHSEELGQKRFSRDSSEENADKPTQDASLSNSFKVNPQADSLARTTGVAIAIAPEWQLVVSPLVAAIECPEPTPEPVIGDLATMGFAEMAPLPRQKKQVALQRAIARLRQAVVPVHDSAAGTVNVTQMVRGVACLLATQSIVLVNHQNQVLDILTPLQQLRLHQRIVLETATYYRRYRLQLGAQRAESHARALSGKWGWRFLPPPRPTRSQKRKILPPVRAFQSLMGWVQTSPVAIATNLFQESALVALPDSSEAMSSRAISGTRSRTGSLPSNSLPSATPAPFPKHSFWQGLLHSLGVSNRSGSAASQNLSGSSTANSTAPIAPQRWFDPDYQSGDNGGLNANDFALSRRQSEVAPAIPSLPRRSRWMPDWASVFFNSGDGLDIDLADEAIEGGAIAPSTPSSMGRSPRFPDPNDNLTDWTSVTALDKSGWNDAELSSSPSSSLSRSPRDSRGEGALAVDEQEPDSLVSTIVEAPATLVGYVKHPLEQFLEWIDLGMVWLENTVEQIWNWLKRSD